ncbi:MAG: DUF1573 domain-containing protein [bacterium]|nr:DUF1573 domain-containing protein [bacterium]
MNNKNFEFSIKINQNTLFIVIVITLLIASGGFYMVINNYHHMNSSMNELSIISIKPVSAAEIYPHFVCSCCGQPLDKESMCCGIAEDMISYIDTRVGEGLTNDEVILTTVKKYGLKSLSSDSEAEDIKKQLAQNAPEDRPEITLELSSYDFGDVSQALGVVNKSFTINNSGSDDLIINNLLSSCGCTSVALVIDGIEGPKFGMHNNPTDWSATIKPGESAELIIYYDPNVHKDFRGAATREVTIFSNDPINFETGIKIKLNQID